MTDTNNTPEPETVTLRGELKVSTFSHGYTIGVEHDGGYTDLYDWLDSRYIVTGDGVQVEIRPLSNDKPESPDSAKNKTDITDQNEPEIERQNLSITEGPECERCGEPNCERCDRCGALVHASCPTYWYAENEFWNTIYGSSDNPCGDGIIRCIACFTNDCADAGHPICWVPRAIGSEPVLPDPHDSIDAKYGPPPEGYEYTGAVRSAAYGDWYLDPCVGPSFWPAGLYDSEVAYPILRRKDSSPEQFRALRPIAHGRTHGMYDPVEPNTAPTADPSLDQFRKLGDSTPATSSPVESEGPYRVTTGQIELLRRAQVATLHEPFELAASEIDDAEALETAGLAVVEYCDEGCDPPQLDPVIPVSEVFLASIDAAWNAALQHIDGLAERLPEGFLIHRLHGKFGVLPALGSSKHIGTTDTLTAALTQAAEEETPNG